MAQVWALVAEPATDTFGVLRLGFRRDGSIYQENSRASLDSDAVLVGDGVLRGIFLNQPEEEPLFASSGGPPVPALSGFQTHHWSHWNGLPADKVRSLIQTQDGYLWVGTVAGLARFDGVQFTVFDETNTPAMVSDGSIARCFAEDEAGRLWIGTERGLLCWFAGDFRPFPGQEALRGVKTHMLKRRSGGGLWIGTEQGLGRLDTDGPTWIPLADQAPVHCLAEGAGGVLWVGMPEVLAALDPKAHRIVRELRSADFALVPGDSIRFFSLMRDGQDRLWIGSSRGVWRLEAQDSAPRLVEAAWTNISVRLVEDRGGRIWVSLDGVELGNQGRIVVLDGETGVAHGSTSVATLPGCEPILDREGTLWVGGRSGLVRVRPQPLTSLYFPGLQLPAQRVMMGAVTCDSTGAVWFSNGARIGRWSASELTLLDLEEVFSPPPTNHWALRPFVVPGPFGRVWMGSGRTEIFCLSLSESGLGVSGTVSRPFPEIDTVWAACRGTAETLWLAGPSGVHRVTGPDQIQRISGLDRSDAQALLEDRQGWLWIGTEGGTLHCSRDHGASVKAVEGSGLGAAILTFHEGGDGTLWIGTDSGLHCLREGHRRSLGPDSGLPQQQIKGIVEDGRGGLWLQGDFGIVRVEVAELEAWLEGGASEPTVTRFGLADGMTTLASKAGSQTTVQDLTGRLWFVRDSGLVTVDPARFTLAPAPTVRVESRWANGQPIAFDSSAPESSRSFRLGQDLHFHLAVTSLTAPDRVQVLWRLEGRDSSWREAGPDRHIRLTDLPPGPYVLQAHARNHEGRLSDADATLAFRIVPWFWQTWTFRGVVGIALLGGVAGWTRWHLRRQRRRLEVIREQELDRQRTRIARDLHDHLGAHLAGIALKAGSDSSSADSVQDSLHALNEVIWSVHPDHDTLSSLVGFLGDLATRSLSALGVAVDIEAPATVPSRSVPGDWRREVVAMVREALRNVIEHAGATRVILRIEIHEEGLQIEVHDDGDGFDPATLDAEAGRRRSIRGYGLRNLEARCRDLSGLCRVTSAPGQGTRVVFLMPLDGVSGSGLHRRPAGERAISR